MSLSDDVKLFGMHNLLLETDLQKLEESGIQIEHAKTIQKAEIVDVDLFESDILEEARKMADFDALDSSPENPIRRLISERLSEKHGANWWKDKVPGGDQPKSVRSKERKRTRPCRYARRISLAYTNFGELISIFDENWGDFSDNYEARRLCRPFCRNSTRFGMWSHTAVL